jgi:hypothetical protein
MIGLTFIGWDGSVWNLRTGPVRLTSEGVEGLSNLDFQVFTQDTALRDGQLMTGWKANARDVILPVLIGQTATELEWLQIERKWMGLMRPDRVHTLQVTAPDGGMRGLSLRFVNDGSKAFSRDPSKSRITTYPMRFIADDPWFIGPSFGKTFVNPARITDFYGGGSVAPRYSWLGTPHASRSSRVAPDGTTTYNEVLNPSAEASTPQSVVSPDNSAYPGLVTDAVTGTGASSYRIITANTAQATVQLATRPAAAVGQRWWGRARMRLDQALVGARALSAMLVFRDSAGAVLGHRQEVVGDATGVTHRWLGMPYASPSERIEGGQRRVNLITNPDQPSARWYGPSGAGNTTAMYGSGIVGGPDRYVRKTWTTAPTSNGNTGFSATAYIPVTPGKTLVFSGWLRSSSNRRKVPGRAKFSWQGIGGDLTQEFITLQPGVWTRTWISHVVPEGVSFAYCIIDVDDGDAWLPGETLDGAGLLAELVDGPVTGPDTYFDGGMPSTVAGLDDHMTIDVVPSGVFHRYTGTATTSLSERYEGTSRRTNYMTDPVPTQVGSWGGEGTGTGAAKTMVAAPGAPSGTAMRATWPSDVTAGFNFSRSLTNLTPGQKYTISTYARASFAGSVVRIAVISFSAQGTGTAFYPPLNAALNASTFTRMSTIFVVPNDSVRVGVYFDNGTGLVYPKANDWIEMSSWLIEEGAETGDYFSGQTANTGTGNSQSIANLLVVGDAPAGTATADLVLYRGAAYSPAAADTVYADQLMLSQSVGTTAPDYFDGATAGKKGATPFYITPANRVEVAQITNPGDIPVWPTYTFKGPIESFRTKVGNGTIAGNFPVPVGSTLTIETSPLRQIALLWYQDGSVENVTRKLSSFGFRPIPAGETLQLDISIVGTGDFTVDGAPHYFRGW